MHASPITQALSSIVIGREIAYEKLEMFPLLKREPDSPGAQMTPNAEPRMPVLEYEVLDDALASGLVEVTEVSKDGIVPELRVVNRGTKPTLIVDGEELIGAKQNRVVNLTILVAANSELTIPVSCVEAGRWRTRSRTFSSAPRTQYASGRAKRMSQVTQSIQVSKAYFSDQSEVWADIAEKSDRLHSSSPTGAMEAMFTDHAPFIDACVRACEPVDGQVGALFTIAGRIVGFDLFDSERTFRKLLPKLVRSVAVDALDSNWGHSSASHDSSAKPRAHGLQTEGQQFLMSAGSAAQHGSPAVGIGEDVRLSAPGLTGAALLVEQHLVHLSAFALP